jgi:hypothetical protein
MADLRLKAKNSVPLASAKRSSSEALLNQKEHFLRFRYPIFQHSIVP